MTVPDAVEDAAVLLLVVGVSVAALGLGVWWLLDWYLGDLGDLFRVE